MLYEKVDIYITFLYVHELDSTNLCIIFVNVSEPRRIPFAALPLSLIAMGSVSVVRMNSSCLFV